MPARSNIDIKPQAANDEACALLALAMRDNPTHVAAYGQDADRRQLRLQAFFSATLPWIDSNGLLFGAFVDGRLAGIFGLLAPGRCRPTGAAAWRLGLRLLHRQRPATMARTLRWLFAWRHNDPAAAHWHLGPLAVRPDHQGHGVGSALMQHGLDVVDAEPTLCYLETDLPRNVDLYQRFGFSVTVRQTVLGVPSWFMQRPPAV